MEHEHLIQGNYYHIFNRGNNHCNLFEKPAEFEHFLWLYDKYISPVADTLAWALMKNHFHLLVYIKKDVVYKYSIETLNRISPDKIWYEEHKWETVDADLSASEGPDNVKKAKYDNVGLEMMNNSGDFNAVKSKDVDRFRKLIPYRHFAHLFNAYSRYLQIRTGRTGNLFERPFKRKIIDNREYLKTVVLYIHNNPVHHGFCNHTLEYPWTSYISSISVKPTKLKRDEIIQLFNGRENFEYQHTQGIDLPEIEKWLEIAPLELHDFDMNLSKSDTELVAADISDANRIDADISDADRSADAVRSGGNFDLSACEAPDNVKKERKRRQVGDAVGLERRRLVSVRRT